MVTHLLARNHRLIEALPGLSLRQSAPRLWLHWPRGNSSHVGVSVADFHTSDVSLGKYEAQSNTRRANATQIASSEMRAKRRPASSEGGGLGTRASGGK